MKEKTNIEQKIDEYTALAKAYILTLRDIRNVGLLAFTLVVLLISWSGIKTIQTNYVLQKQISQLKQENAVHKLQNTNLQFQNQYYATNQYLEVTARQNLGLGAAGETELLVPKDVALAHTVDPAAAEAGKTALKKAFWQTNFEAWMDFFLHRPTVE